MAVGRKSKQCLRRVFILVFVTIFFLLCVSLRANKHNYSQRDPIFDQLLVSSNLWIKQLNKSLLELKTDKTLPPSDSDVQSVENTTIKIFKRNISSTTILDLEKIEFLPHYRNPCWLEPLDNATNPYIHNRYGGKVSGYMSNLSPRWNTLFTGYVQEGREERLRCLPYFLLGGFPKCGTTDLYDMLAEHPLIAGCLFKEPHYWTRWRFWTDKCFWHEFLCADGSKCLPQTYHCNGRQDCSDGSDEANCGNPLECSQYNGGCSHTCTMTSEGSVCSCPRGYQLKRDKKTCVGGVPLSDYVDLFDVTAATIQSSTEVREQQGKMVEYHPIVTGEATPATFWDNHRWRDEVANDGNHTDPTVLTAHVITHLLPNVKNIVIVRNPTKRLYSDLLYFKPYATPEYFHSQVVQGISWFNNCTKTRSVRSCVYEPMDPERPPEGRYWHPVERIRIGMYSQYIKDWYEVVPRSHIKVIRLEDYSSDRMATLKDIINFLELENMAGIHEQKWASASHKNSGAKKYDRQGNMLPETQKLLDEFYKPFNEELASLLQDDKYVFS